MESLEMKNIIEQINSSLDKDKLDIEKRQRQKQIDANLFWKNKFF